MYFVLPNLKNWQRACRQRCWGG